MITTRQGFNVTREGAGLFFYPPEDWLSRFDNFLVKGPLPCVTSLTSVTPTSFPGASFDLWANVSAPAGCAWQVDTDADWLVLETPLTGTGSATIHYGAPANLTDAPRHATIVVGGQAFVVTQYPAGPGCGSACDVGEPPPEPPPGTPVYYTTDAIGSVRMTTDALGQVIAHYDFLPFGEQWDPQGTDARMFAGAERDTTGFDYLGARYYSSLFSGRFTTPDASVFGDPSNPQSWNLYTYGLNNPLRYVDPTGNSPECVETPDGVRCAESISVTAPGPTDMEIFLSNIERQFHRHLIIENTPPPTIGPAPPIPWYENSCIMGALKDAVPSTVMDGLGLLIPEGGLLAGAIGRSVGWRGVVAAQQGTKAIRTGKFGLGVANTGRNASDKSALGAIQTTNGLASIGLTIARAAPLYGQILSGLALAGDAYGAIQAVRKCN